MKKNTVIRSDSPHTVKMQAGSNVAQRKPAAKDKLHDAQAAPTIDNIQFLPPEPPQTSAAPASAATVKPKRAKARVGQMSEDAATRPPAKAGRPAARQTKTPPGDQTGSTRGVKTALKTAAKAKPVKVAPPKATPTSAKTAEKPSPKATAPKPRSAQTLETPAASVWEEDNPIRHRLALLRTRNAQLEEQLQRLNQSMPARGKRP